MLTDHDRATHEETGLVTPERLRALQHGLRARSDDARQAARQEGIDERFAASLRGKAHAYQEAADLVQQLLYGAPMRPPRWSAARKRARAYQERRGERIAARQAAE